MAKFYFIKNALATFKVGLLFLLVVSTAQSADLIAVYRQALKSDPLFKAAQAHWQSQRTLIAQAHSALFPHIVLDAESSYQHIDVQSNSSFPINSDSQPYRYGASLQQPLFDFSAWSALKQAHAIVKAADADYLAAEQSLIMRTAEHYFAVLEAYDNLTFVQAEKKAVGHQLKQTAARYKVGLATVTAFYEAKARYDLILAEEIASKNALANQIEALREITGCYYKQLKTVKKSLPLLSPQPTSIDRWAEAAQHQNYRLLASYYTVLDAHQAIGTAAASRWPTLNATADLHWQKSPGISSFVQGTTRITEAGLALNFPVFQGGFVNAKTHQALHQYQEASDQYNALLRQIVSQTRQSYLGILAGISKIRADKKVIRSSRSALKANQSGYEVGTRTMIDVLNSQADLYRAQQDQAKDVYKYLLDTLRLKEYVGRLSVNDLIAINHWLPNDIDI